MKVLKFGGTSVGTPDSLTNVREIVCGGVGKYRQIVVVSALGGLTDKLIATARLAENDDRQYVDEYNSIVARHKNIVETMVPESLKASTYDVILPLLSELGDIYKGISLIRDLSQRSLDKIVSYGERLSSSIIVNIIPGARLFDSRFFIKTVKHHGSHVLDNELTQRLIHNTFDNLDFDVAVVPGFISTDADDIVTNLGRGGSDYTAAILAAALDADSLEIWTDVNGFMTADPRIVSTAKVIDELSFIEAMELCNLGAKVVYPPTIYPVFHKNIPIYIKNTFNPSAPGTRVSDTYTKVDGLSLKGVSSIADCCLMFVSGQCLFAGKDDYSRILNTLGRNGLNVSLVNEIDSAPGLVFSLRMADMQRAMDALTSEFKAELETGEMEPIKIIENVATIGVVGENVKENSADLLKDITASLSGNAINVYAHSPFHIENSVSVIVDEAKRKEALCAIHDNIFN